MQLCLKPLKIKYESQVETQKETKICISKKLTKIYVKGILKFLNSSTSFKCSQIVIKDLLSILYFARSFRTNESHRFKNFQGPLLENSLSKNSLACQLEICVCYFATL